jgi:hypothetical protein
VSKLTPEIREQILTHIANGASYEDAAEWVGAHHGISVTKQAIGKLVAKHRSERSEVSKAVARDHIARTLPADLAASDEKHAQAGRLLDIAAAAAESDPTVANFEKYAKASATFLKWEELKRKTLGLDQPDDAFLDNIVDLAGLALEEEDQAVHAAAFDDDDASDGEA